MKLVIGKFCSIACGAKFFHKCQPYDEIPAEIEEGRGDPGDNLATLSSGVAPFDEELLGWIQEAHGFALTK